ncbi:MAG: hypothetical protein FWE91_10215 [Defluviitaleaceae bacterium]|nr:hypothetical protein [Defluviitaleaceae bacterium]MCL2836901.1 hypothetical protein [Defluviitaleaceae bacterium]
MVDRESIKIMSKLASYDKYYAAGDRKKAEYFRHDYVYRQNMATRFFTLIGSFIVVGFYFMHKILIDGLDVLNIRAIEIDLIMMGIFVILMQFLYSLLGFVLHSMDYNAAQQRIDEYAENMGELARHRSPGNVEYITRERPYKDYEPDDDEYY